MFMHTNQKYSNCYIWAYNQYLTQTDGINLCFPQKINNNLLQTVNIPYSRTIIYCSVIQFVTRCTRKVGYHEDFVCVEVLQPSQPNGVMSSMVSLPNHTFTGQA